MPAYVPNATQTTEPVESRTVESAALEFRTLKSSINSRIADLEAKDDLLDTEDAALQAEIDAVEVRTLALEQLAFNGSTPGTVVVQRFVTDAIETAFTLGVTPVTVAAVDAYINGVYQNHDTFSVSGNVVTFSEAPAAGILELQVSVPLQIGVTTADAVEYTPAGTGAVTTTVQAKLREAVSVKDFGAVGNWNGTTGADDTVAIQAALTYASANYATVMFPPGRYKVSATLNAGNASINGGATRQARIDYTGTGNMLGAVNAYGIRFSGSGKAGTQTAIKIVDGYRNLIQNCQFDNIGTGIEISGSGQKISDSIFLNCGSGVHVVKYSPAFGNEPTTTFTSEKNWFEGCNKGLWIDSTGATTGMISCSSKDDIFQLNTGYAVHIASTTFPFTLINPHTEQNSAGGNYAIGFGNGSAVTWIGGYQAAGETNQYGTNISVNHIQYDGVFAVTPYRVNNLDGSKYFFEADPQTSVMTYASNPTSMRQLFSGGGYGATNSARFDLQGGRGDNGYYYGSFIESQRTAAYGNGVNLHFGAIQAGATDTYTRRVTIDYLGTLYAYADNTQALGGPSNRWSVVYAGTGTINTSDEREKQDIADLDAAEKRVAVALKGLVKKFRFKDAVAAKGDGARIHVGVIAQEVVAAFQAEGLDPMRYAIVCYDEWKAELDDDGNEIRPAGNRYGVRYEELLAFIISAL